MKLNTDVLCAENELLRLLSELDIKNNVSNYYSYLARSDYDDGIRMFNSQNFIASRECLRKAVIYQAGAINSVYGSINLKEKWISTIFLGLNQVENMDIVPMYLKNIVYEEVTEKNIESVCKSLILLYQMMVSEVAFNS
ncbi:hypothetical protein D2A77_13990 [Enterococcus faecalis]|nr:hypothetical protein [Enterococcus faecalis]